MNSKREWKLKASKLPQITRRKSLQLIAFLVGSCPTIASPICFFGWCEKAKRAVKAITPRFIQHWGNRVLNTFKKTRVGKVFRNLWRPVNRLADAINRTWFEINWSWYFSPPNPEIVGEKRPGDPIFFVNGVWNSLNDAKQSSESLSAKLNRPVYVIYNTRKLLGVGDIAQAISDALWIVPFPSLSRASRQLAHLFVKGRGRISIVSHSQGCLQVLNAIQTVIAYQGNSRRLKEKVRWVAAGWDLDLYSPFTARRDSVNKFTGLMNRGDLAAILGDPSNYLWPDDNKWKARFGHEFRESYVNQITEAMIWPSVRSTNPRLQQINTSAIVNRRIVVQNITDNPVEARFAIMHTNAEGEQTRYPTRAAVSQHVEPHSEAELKLTEVMVAKATHLWFEAKCGETALSIGSQENFEPISGPNLSDDLDVYPIVVEDDDSPTMTWGTPFATCVLNEKETVWLGVSKRFAFTLNEDYEVKAFQQASDFVGSEKRFLAYTELFDTSGDVFLVPASGDGIIEKRFGGDPEKPGSVCPIATYKPDRLPPDWKIPDDFEFATECDCVDHLVLGVSLVDDPRGLVVVSEVVKNSPADIQGLKPGDVIRQINGVRNMNAIQAAEIVKTAQGTMIDVSIIQTGDGDQERTIRIKLGPVIF